MAAGHQGDDGAKLRDLEARIKAAKGEVDKPEVSEVVEHYSQAQLAWRMVTELVVGLLLGAAIGYGLDVLFGAAPWFLIVFCMLGFAAGIRTMMRTAEEVQKAINTPDGGEGT